MAQIVSLISGKGGTGKTSLCAGIAACLARDGFRVLAIDLDVGLRNLDIALGMTSGSVRLRNISSLQRLLSAGWASAHNGG